MTDAVDRSTAGGGGGGGGTESEGAGEEAAGPGRSGDGSATPEVVIERSTERKKKEGSAPGDTVSSLLRHARRMVVLVVGSTVVAIGVAMLVLPGPAVVVIPAGIAILATEFAWARHLLREVKARIGLGEARGAGSGRDLRDDA